MNFEHPTPATSTALPPCVRYSRIILIVALLAGISDRYAQANEPAGTEQFEKHIRPILVQHCGECHGEKKQAGGLRLDSRDGWKTGGDSGAAIVPGKPEESLLLEALQHKSFKMPPKGKLPAEVIQHFETWIRDGAPDPRVTVSDSTAATKSWPQEFEKRQKWWSLQPVVMPEVPTPRNVDWSTHPVDRFLLAKMEAAGLEPTADADPVTFERRLSFVLTGLPPTVAEIDQFRTRWNAGNPPGAASQAVSEEVERLLTSPHFGEQWARHWMDLVRFSETHGSEQDGHIRHAWRYRDYLIRAFNSDVPYDQLVKEHLAGDLLPHPRLRAGGFNESIHGAAWLHFVEFYHTPVDVKQEEVNVLETRIDNLGKTFQGLTIACARCHDHKFDAISQRDFQALYSVFASTRMAVRQTNDPTTLHVHDEELLGLRSGIRERVAQVWLNSLNDWAADLAAAWPLIKSKEALPAPVADADRRRERWIKALQAATSPDVPLTPVANWARQLTNPEMPINLEEQRTAWQQQQAAADVANRDNFQVIADFRSGKPADWFEDGPTFRTAADGDLVVAATGHDAISRVSLAGRHTDLVSSKHGGALRSPNFIIEARWISALVQGTGDARLRLVIENFQGDSVLFTSVMPRLNDAQYRWITLPVRDQWVGRRGYLELVTGDEMTYAGRVNNSAGTSNGHRSSAGISVIVNHLRDGSAPRVVSSLPISVFEGGSDVKSIAERLATATQSAIEAWRDGRASALQVQWVAALQAGGLLPAPVNSDAELTRLVTRYREIEEQIPFAERVPSVVEEAFVDEPLFQRGNHRRHGEIVPRGYLAALSTGAAFPASSSGRLEIAELIASPRNPLTARVMVNRIWQHVFGLGLVASPDNFGHLGETPTHPELLDWLADEFVKQGWSVKSMVRLLVTSRAFRLSTRASAHAAETDPANRLLSHASLRRLQAEEIRDAVLRASGRLDVRSFGEPVPVYIEATRQADNFPVPASGPIDGAGRRSIYIELRRNFLPSFLQVFDFPKPTDTIGRRNLTQVPAQSLALFNDPFVIGEAERLGKVLAEFPQTVDQRIAEAYLRIVNRPPTEIEVSLAREWLQSQSTSLGLSDPDLRDPRPWKDFAHACFNMKEFLYLR